jgi:hypothetical protein
MIIKEEGNIGKFVGGLKPGRRCKDGRNMKNCH